MIKPVFRKTFLEKLYSAGSMTLAEALVLLSPEHAPKFDEINEALQYLWVEDLFSIHTQESGEELWLEKSMLKQADAYLISLKSIASKDRNIASGSKGKILDNDINQFSDLYCWAVIKPKAYLKIRGKRDGAPLLAERIRVFAQYVGCLLLQRKFAALSSLFVPDVGADFTPEGLAQTMESLEQDYGVFDCFDQVEVSGVYCERHLEAETSDLMPLPAGIDAEQRRGEASLKLVSVHSPNGMPIHGVLVLLDIVEDADRFRLASMRWKPE